MSWRLLFSVLHLLSFSALAQGPDKAGSSAACAPSLKREKVPRDELRQQILAGIYETRFSYSLARAPGEVDLFAECYTDGRMTHRFQLTSAMDFNKPEYAKGILSLGWNYLKHELTLINDNGFGLWNAHFSVPNEIMESPPIVVGAETPVPELRDTVNDYPEKQVTIFPVIGLVGKSSDTIGRQVHFSLASATNFLDQVAKYHSRQCVIIYLFGDDGGGVPPFVFKGPTGFYQNSLPMN